MSISSLVQYKRIPKSFTILTQMSPKRGPLNAVGIGGILMSIMQIKMNDSNIRSVAQLRELVKFTNSVEFNSSSTKEETYKWIEEALMKFHYFSLKSKRERGIILSYIKQMTGLSRGHVKKLVKKRKRNRKEEVFEVTPRMRGQARGASPHTRRSRFQHRPGPAVGS